MRSVRQLWVLCDSYQLYATVISPIRRLWALCDSYESYATVTSSMRQLWVLSDSYQLYATVMRSMRQLWILSDSYKKNQLQCHYWATVLLGHRRILKWSIDCRKNQTRKPFVCRELELKWQYVYKPYFKVIHSLVLTCHK